MPRGLARVQLLLDPSLVARRQLVLPLAAEENLRQVLEFEMDRRTPFRADDVVFDWRVLERSVANHALTLELVVVPRERLKEWRSRLAVLGFAAQCIDVLAGQPEPAARGLGVDLLASEAATGKGGTQRRINRGLALAGLCLLVAVLVVPTWRMQLAERQLGDQVEAARADALAVVDRLDVIERRHGGLQQLLERRQREPAVVARLAELARVLPDDTWLQQLELGDGRMIVQGESARAAALIERLEASPLLGAASFEAPVDTDPTSGQERFRIALRLHGGGAP
ncbi:hypothetical protein C6V82_00050 [Halomonas urumqiensis]|nr:hypothetical protein C6V82_00050 [Halomonas urumqiensis]